VASKKRLTAECVSSDKFVKSLCTAPFHLHIHVHLLSIECPISLVDATGDRRPGTMIPLSLRLRFSAAIVAFWRHYSLDPRDAAAADSVRRVAPLCVRVLSSEPMTARFLPVPSLLPQVNPPKTPGSQRDNDISTEYSYSPEGRKLMPLSRDIRLRCKAAPSAKHHNAGTSTSNALAACHPSINGRLIPLFDFAIEHQPFPASVIF
jgi:hypothetical protein